MSELHVQDTEVYSQTTREIVVDVSPAFLPEQSDLDHGVYAYAYSVTLTNSGPRTVQLINRHWIVESGGRQIADVKGEGVVGRQPVLKPGEKYTYTSWTTVRDPVGAMFGSYTLYSETGEFFDVDIPRFNLMYIDSSAVH